MPAPRRSKPTADPGRPGVRSPSRQRQRGGFVLGLVMGLLAGLGVALAVALYITKAPIPFVNKVPQRSAEQDAAEAERNKHWDPNAPLAGKNPARPQPVPVEPALPAPASAPLEPGAIPPPTAAVPASRPTPPVAAASAARPARDPAAILSGQPAPADGTVPARMPGREQVLGAARPGAAATPPATPASGASVQFYVQVGAYSTPDDAEAQRARMAMMGQSARVLQREQAGRTVYRVRMGPFDNRNVAEDVQDKLSASGIEANLVRVER